MADLLLVSKFQKSLKSRAEDMGRMMAGGACASYSDYREMVGIVKGLNDALVIFEQLFLESNTDDVD